MPKKILYVRRAGYTDIEQYKGDRIDENDDGVIEVRDGEKQVAKVSDVEWHTIGVSLDYDEIWSIIDDHARKKLGVTGEVFMHRYFTDQMSYYHLAAFRTLCHLADLIDSEYLEKQRAIHSES